VNTKINLVSELLTSATSTEAKYIIRTLLEDMRIGIGDSTIRDSIIWSSFNVLAYNPDEKDDKKKYTIKGELDIVQRVTRIISLKLDSTFSIF
jgi:DNA ligase-1